MNKLKYPTVLLLLLALNISVYATGIEKDFIHVFLNSFNTGKIDSMNSFISKHYHPNISNDKERFQKVSLSFGTLYDEFGPLEIHSIQYDSTYKSDKYFLKGTYTKEWVAVMFVLNKEKQILGQGIWKLQMPEGEKNRHLSVADLPIYLDSHLEELSQHDFFSGSILIAHSNKIIYHKAFGKKNPNEVLAPDSKYPVASITKLFMGIAVARLIDKQLVNPNDLLSEYIKEYPEDISRQVSVKHLLLHTSGIEMDDSRSFRERRSVVKNLNDLLQLHVAYLDSLNENRRINFRPLNHYDYTNEGYDLLGIIVERVTGLSVEGYIAREICTPLEMKQTSFTADPGMYGKTQYDDNGNYYPTQWFSQPFKTGEAPLPSGGLHSTTSDLFKLYLGLKKEKLFKSDWIKRLTMDTVSTGGQNFYGYGLEGKMYNNHLGYGHSGGDISGVNAEFRYFPGLDLFIVVLCNRNRSASDLVFHISNMITSK
ncbi:MAG: beta-lactamase family protein [Cyclobacteriaceae bacterium]|nr:beta-lactamase family protein [Cyclobacteriaceae bacterium]